MMTMKQIMAITKCSRATAAAALMQANIKRTVVRFAHGRKHFYEVNPERLPEIMADYKRDPEQIAMQQGAALMELEAAFNRVARMQ